MLHSKQSQLLRLPYRQTFDVPQLSSIPGLISSSQSRIAANTSNRVVRNFWATSVLHGKRPAKKRTHRDPFVTAQAKARKEAHESRKKDLSRQRAVDLGDPVYGKPTQFAISLGSKAQPVPPLPSKIASSGVGGNIDVSSASAEESIGAFGETSSALSLVQDGMMNYFVREEEFKEAVERSELLAAPTPRIENQQVKSVTEAEQVGHAVAHATAREAMSRILSLQNSNSKDKLHHNIQRCITTFGRHNTDKTLKPKPYAQRTGLPIAISMSQSNAGTGTIKPSDTTENKETLARDIVPMRRKRAGDDTGSSEVQIAILTSKINTLAGELTVTGRKDKMNKRNLRLLVHKRQKLLRYLWRKERAGPRWQYLVEQLGITDVMWKGEISM